MEAFSMRKFLLAVVTLVAFAGVSVADNSCNCGVNCATTCPKPCRCAKTETTAATATVTYQLVPVYRTGIFGQQIFVKNVWAPVTVVTK
jgi:hypothetical protein